MLLVNSHSLPTYVCLCHPSSLSLLGLSCGDHIEVSNADRSISSCLVVYPDCHVDVNVIITNKWVGGEGSEVRVSAIPLPLVDIDEITFSSDSPVQEGTDFTTSSLRCQVVRLRGGRVISSSRTGLQDVVYTSISSRCKSVDSVYGSVTSNTSCSLVYNDNRVPERMIPITTEMVLLRDAIFDAVYSELCVRLITL
jgi:hypothetical protein